jgi:hypothetical protein
MIRPFDRSQPVQTSGGRHHGLQESARIARHRRDDATFGGHMNTPAAAPKAPWHLWVVGVLALLWNSGGAFDYLMTQTRNPGYMGSFTPEQLAYFYGFPRWVVATWALSVWGGVAGAVLVLLRQRLAVWVFAVSLAAMVPTFFHNYVLTDGFAIMGGVGALIFTAVIVAVGAALLLYARGLASRGLLR